MSESILSDPLFRYSLYLILLVFYFTFQTIVVLIAERWLLPEKKSLLGAIAIAFTSALTDIFLVMPGTRLIPYIGVIMASIMVVTIGKVYKTDLFAAQTIFLILSGITALLYISIDYLVYTVL